MAEKYVLLTNRLGFKLLEQEDIDFILDLESDPDVTEFVGGVLNKEEVLSMVEIFVKNSQEKELPHFLIFELSSGRCMGRCGFSQNDSDEIEVGYGFHKEYWGKGFATETLVVLLSWAEKHIATNNIIAVTAINHLASQRVMEKCGMQYYKTEFSKGVESKFYKKELEGKK